MLFLGRSWRSRGGLYSIIRVVHLRQDAGCACENGPLKHCLKKTEHGVATRLAASTPRSPGQRRPRRGESTRASSAVALRRAAALIALDVGEPDFGEVRSRVPHQRAVAIDPEVGARLVITEHRKP